MTTLVMVFLFMLTMVGAMAIGVIMGRPPISGSCGGMKALGMDVECEICGGNPALCDSDAAASADTPAQSEREDVKRLSTRVGR